MKILHHLTGISGAVLATHMVVNLLKLARLSAFVLYIVFFFDEFFCYVINSIRPMLCCFLFLGVLVTILGEIKVVSFTLMDTIFTTYVHRSNQTALAKKVIKPIMSVCLFPLYCFNQLTFDLYFFAREWMTTISAGEGVESQGHRSRVSVSAKCMCYTDSDRRP